MVPTFTFEPFDGIGAQLCPCSIATATPQAFTVASVTSESNQSRSSRPVNTGRYALQPSPDPSRSSWWVT